MAYGDDGTDSGRAPALVIEQDSRIVASGSQGNPITFTSAVTEQNLPQRGLWGGLIICGRAPITTSDGSAVDTVEGVDGSTYGGFSSEDNSGVLSYVRVWYGGSVV
eukprot:4847764-Prorocentrum_lima.AAC.1